MISVVAPQHQYLVVYRGPLQVGHCPRQGRGKAPGGGPNSESLHRAEESEVGHVPAPRHQQHRLPCVGLIGATAVPVPELEHLRQSLQPPGCLVSGDVGAGGEDVRGGGVVRDEASSAARVLQLIAGTGGAVLQIEQLCGGLVVVVPSNDHQTLWGEPAGVVRPVAHRPGQARPLPRLQVHGNTVVPREVV